LDNEDLQALKKKLEEEEKAYALVLGTLDALADFPLPSQKDLGERMVRLNALWESPRRPDSRGLGGALEKRSWDALAPALARQQEFNTVLVQVLNERLASSDALHARLKEVVSALIQYLQRVLPTMDARDRMSTALATSRSELILEAFDRRQEGMARRLDGLLALKDRLEALSEEVRALRGTLAAKPPAAALAAAASGAADDSQYVAFENRFRGDREEIRRRLAHYVDLFRDLSPVADLGCGRGEFLELLKEVRIHARGVEGNAHLARGCRERGLDVVHGDLLAFLRDQKDASLGGLFAAQVAEHLPPPVLKESLAEAHRILRPGGLLILETINPRSVLAFLEVYNRDLTHERPLHPETLSFLAAAQGFTDVRVEYRSPVDAATRLQTVPTEGLPPRAAAALNENIARLNDFLYAPQEYALLARR
jgi:SAM-dependent methyltransferase